VALYYKDLVFIVDQSLAEVLPFTGNRHRTLPVHSVPNLFNCHSSSTRRPTATRDTEGVEVGITQPVWGVSACRLLHTPMRRCARSAVPGNSKNSYNFTAVFENSLLSARLSWQQRSNFF